MADSDKTLTDVVRTSADPLEPKDAIEYFRSKVAVTGNEWADLISQNHDWAFKLAGVADIDVIEQVYSALDTAIASGTGFDEFKESIGEQLENAWGGTVSNPGWRIETIFRTNVQTSYQAGHRKQAYEQKGDRPYGMLDVVEDDATSDICADLDDQIGGQAISLDDPIWNTAWPPNHYNCRSSVITMTEEEAIAQGLLDEPPEVEVDDDFGEDGSDGEPDPEDYPEDLQESLGRFL